mgnify:FL=1
MNIFPLGKRLYKLRLERKISQKDLCDGLCSIPSLSRIESGDQVPSRKLLESLYQRCGYKAPVNDVPATDVELQRDNLETEISLCFLKNGNNDIDTLLDEYKNCSEKMNKFEEQNYILFSLISKAKKLGYTFEQKKSLLDAFLLTHPNFQIEDLYSKKIFLTATEITIINNIAIADIKLSKQKEAIAIFEFLKNYIENNIIDEEEKAKIYPAIILNLASLYDDIGNYKKAVKLMKESIKICANYGKFLLAPCITNYGFFIARNGNIDTGISILKDGLLFFEYLGDTETVKQGKQAVKTYFDIDI